MDFCVLPAELLHTIISVCELPELLTLRMVSRGIKTMVDSSLRFKDEVAKISINLHATTLATFVQTAPVFIPFTNFNINLSSPMGRYDDYDSDPSETPEFYKSSSHLNKFKEVFCPRIRKLRVSTMFACTVDSELEFFDTLKNLRDLEIHELRPLIGGKTIVGEEVDPSCPLQPIRLPSGVNMKLMKRLVVDEEVDSTKYLVDWIKASPVLEEFQIPKSWTETVTVVGNGINFSKASNWEFCVSMENILMLGGQNFLPQLKKLNLNEARMDMDTLRGVQKTFLEILLRKGDFSFDEVSPRFLNDLRGDKKLGGQVLEDFKERIVVFDGMSMLLKTETLRKVEELRLKFDKHNRFNYILTDNWNYNMRKIDLPALRKISGVISPVHEGREEVEDFLKCIFEPMEPRTKVTELDIEYRSQAADDWLPIQPILTFRPNFFDLGFPSLTRISFKADKFSPEELIELLEIISRKAQLEELSLCTSRGIPEHAFFGNVQNEPIFLRLQKLRKLKLDSAFKQPRSDPFARSSVSSPETMGNGILKQIISKMGLTHLEIIGGGWKSVTGEGIKSLMKGPLGQTLLWADLEALKGISCDGDGGLERLSRVCHNNRRAKNLTTTSFEEFKASEGAFVTNEFGFRNCDWKEKVCKKKKAFYR